MPDTTPNVLSDTHALMAVGSLSATLQARLRSGAEGDPDFLAPFPEPPEWLELYEEAVEATRDDARRALLEEYGALEPSASEEREVIAIARAHYESYTRLDVDGQARTGGFIPWASIPTERRALMQAVIADMLAGRTIRVGSAAAHPPGARDLYVVFGGTAGDRRFVAVEDHAGSNRPVRGMRWEPHPDAAGLWRLGPFPAAPPGMYEDLPGVVRGPGDELPTVTRAQFAAAVRDAFNEGLSRGPGPTDVEEKVAESIDHARAEAVTAIVDRAIDQADCIAIVSPPAEEKKPPKAEHGAKGKA
jgi:hypothetical protein